MHAWQPTTPHAPSHAPGGAGGYRDAARATEVRGALPGSGLRTAVMLLGAGAIFGLVAAVTLILVGGIMATEEPDIMGVFLGLAMLGIVAAVFSLQAQAVLGVVWVHKMWSWLPEQERHARHWSKPFSPGQAACFLLIPYFQYFWMFVVNLGIADALDRMQLQVAPTPYAAPVASARGTAVAACICTLVFWPAAVFLWPMYMRRIETAAQRVARVG